MKAHLIFITLLALLMAGLASPGGGLLQRTIVGLIAGVFLLVIFLATLVRLIGANLF